MLLTSTGSNILQGDISMSIYSRKNYPPGFYVYAYINSSGLPYYIGKGIKNRAWQKHRVDLPPDDMIKILESNLTELGAFAIERRLINWWGREDKNEGTLLNRAEGGFGSYDISNTTKQLLSERKKGKSRPEWVRQKISAKMKGKSNFEGKTHSEQSKKAISCSIKKSLVIS